MTNAQFSDPASGEQQFNLGTGIFPSWNDNNGIMLCGYEWGGDPEGDHALQPGPRADAVFSNKALRYGPEALTWRYDRRILHWFDLWGHPLKEEGLGGSFEKCLIQTNWCNTQSHKIQGSIWRKVLDPDQIDNFIAHIKAFEPRLLLLFGSVLIKVLQNPQILPRFEDILGNQNSELELERRPYHGRKFAVGFQSFERCDVVCLPHPSSTRGLSDEYVALFTPEMDRRISALKAHKAIAM